VQERWKRKSLFKGGGDECSRGTKGIGNCVEIIKGDKDDMRT
jgi:hypothetical protein